MLVVSNGQAQQAPTNNSESLKRVTFDIKYISSDEMGGRQPGTPGIQLCQDYIVQEFEKAGLKPLENGTYLQQMEVGNKRLVNQEEASLVLKGPNDEIVDLELGKDFQQLIVRDDFDLASELVFVGYGISAEDHNYDDFAGVDVEGKVVVLIRREPQIKDPDSVFKGEQTSRHASGRQKVTYARRAKAAGILMVNDSVSAGEEDGLIQPDRFRTNSLPFAQITRRVFNEILRSSPLTAPTGKRLDSIEKIEALIDSNLEPISQPLEDWTVEFRSNFIEQKIETNNIIGIIEGQGPNADETIVIGAHYDHLGTGAYGSRTPGRREIHNGADDNATGTSAVIELARRFGQSEEKPGRRLVFVCFTAEEMGLLGAFHYCENPIYPLEKTAAMVNFDMIGWLRDNRLTLYNWNSSADLDPVFESANDDIDFDLNKPVSAFAGSDHLPFNQRNVPNVFIHTGITATYHTPEDDFETIDCEGMLKVIDYSEKVIEGLASLEKRPEFGRPKPFRLGVMLSDKAGTVTIERVFLNSIAEQVGIQKGDVIMEIDGEVMTKRRQISRIIRRDVGKTIQLKLRRDEEVVMMDVELKQDDE